MTNGHYSTLSGTRPPVPAWLWLVFAFGPSLLAAVAIALLNNDPRPVASIAATVIYGVFGGFCFTVGLALASRFYFGTRARVLGGLAAGLTVILVIISVLFAGCMCLTHGQMAVIGAH